MLQGPVRLSILSGALAFGAIGVALMLAGAGVPFLPAGGLAAAAAGLVHYAASRALPAAAPVEPPAPVTAPAPAPVSVAAPGAAELEAYRAHTAALRHDLRGVLSPALMISDRLIRHEDPVVQRAGQTVVRSIDRATALISAHKDALTAEQPAQAQETEGPPG